MDDTPGTELYGLSLVEAIDRFYAHAVDRLVPRFAAQRAKDAQELNKQAIDILAEIEARETKREAQTRRQLEEQRKAAGATLSKPIGRDGEAEVRRLLEAHQVVSIRFEVGYPTRMQLAGFGLRRREHEALSREVMNAFEPLIEGLRAGTLRAEGTLDLQSPKQIPRHLFLAACTIHRQGARIVVHDNGGRPRLTYSTVKLAARIKVTLSKVQAAAMAMDALCLPLGSIDKTSFERMREQLKAMGDPVSARCAMNNDVALKKLMQRAQDLRQKSARSRD